MPGFGGKLLMKPERTDVFDLLKARTYNMFDDFFH